MSSKDILIDIDTLPAEITERLAAWLEQYRSAPRFERQLQIGLLSFAIRMSPRGSQIPASELRAALDRHTEIATAAERTARKQAAQLRAEQERDLAKSHADFLAALSPRERGLLAAQLSARAAADASAARGADQLVKEKEALAKEVTNLTRAGDALRDELTQLRADAEGQRKTARRHAAEAEGLARQNRALGERVDGLRANRDQLAADIHRLMAEKQALEREIARLNDANKEYAADIAELIETAKVVLADSHAAEQEASRFRAEGRRWKAQAQGDARAAARDRAENNALRAQNAALAADKQVIENVNWWLQEKLRFRREPANAA